MAAFLVAAPATQARSAGTRASNAQSQYDRAEQLHLALDQEPEAQRTRRDYDRVLDAYRAVYHGDPASSKADASISTVADLLAEEGRLFHSQKSLRDAESDYEFLRREYPTSRYRFSALLAEGELYQRDLGDPDQAASKFHEFLDTYPRNPLAEQARADLREIRKDDAPERNQPDKTAVSSAPTKNAASAEPAVGRSLAAAPATAAVTALAQLAQPVAEPGSPVKAGQPQSPKAEPAASQTASDGAGPLEDAGHSDGAGHEDHAQHERASRVTGIRYWSTPHYTRIAVDLEDQVPYRTARVPNPDRVYFDLHDAHLVKSLLGKSIPVNDDGFLKRIRAAQYSENVTRIVLDVGSAADYSAFFLPNPWRLIIDIRNHSADAPPLEIVENGPTIDRAFETSAPVPPAAVPNPSKQKPESPLSPPVAEPVAANQGHPIPSHVHTAKEPVVVANQNQASPSQMHTAKEPVVAANQSQPVPSPMHTAKEIGSAPPAPSPHEKVTEGTAAAAPPNPPAPSPRENVKESIAAAAPPNPPAPSPRENVRESIAAAATRSGGGSSGGSVGSTSGGSGSASLPAAGSSKKPSPDHPLLSTQPVLTASASGSQPEGIEKSLANGTDLPANRERGPANERERSLARTLGLKIGRIVIDPGHGGHDCGTLGPGGIQEKDIVLDVALRLGKLLKQRLGADVIFTRDDDTFVPLETRTAIANNARADLFISIHANSSSDTAARGVESYYLNFTTSPDALEVAARENAVSDESIYQLSDLVKEITLKDKIEESRAFAADVQTALYTGLEQGNPGLKDRGVKKAPFVVLIGADMPSILAEISFLTNPKDARELRQPAYRQRIAESLYRGVARYIDDMNGVRLAENRGQPGGN